MPTQPESTGGFETRPISTGGFETRPLLENLVSNFTLSLMSNGFTQCETCIELQKVSAMLHHHYTLEHYPDMTDALTAKMFADCCEAQCRRYLRDEKGFIR
jgi:hypothetical protein